MGFRLHKTPDAAISPTFLLLPELLSNIDEQSFIGYSRCLIYLLYVMNKDMSSALKSQTTYHSYESIYHFMWKKSSKKGSFYFKVSLLQPFQIGNTVQLTKCLLWDMLFFFQAYMKQ